MLKLRTKYQGDDISNLKIYWDTEKKQFRHKFICDTCGATLNCMCYDTISDAVVAVHNGGYCDKCWIKEALTINEMMDYLSKEQYDKLEEIIVDMFTRNQIRDIIIDFAEHEGLGDVCNI